MKHSKILWFGKCPVEFVVLKVWITFWICLFLLGEILWDIGFTPFDVSKVASNRNCFASTGDTFTYYYFVHHGSVALWLEQWTRVWEVPGSISCYGFFPELFFIFFLGISLIFLFKNNRWWHLVLKYIFNFY
jgi:hypothetical protein